MESPCRPCPSKSRIAARHARRDRRAFSATSSASPPRCFRPSGASLRPSCVFASVCWNHFAFKYAAKMRCQALCNFFPGCAATKLGHGSHGPGQATRNNVLEIAEIGCNVQRETVGCHPTADVHAHGGDLTTFHPYASELRDASREYVEIRQRVDKHLFDGAHVGAHVPLPIAQIEDRIAHHLARAVISDVSAAVRGMEGGAGSARVICARQQVFWMAVAAQRNGVRMLEEHKLVWNGAGFSPGDELLLHLEGPGIVEASGFAQLALRHRWPDRIRR